SLSLSRHSINRGDRAAITGRGRQWRNRSRGTPRRDPLAVSNDGRPFFDWKGYGYDGVEVFMSFTTRLSRTVLSLVCSSGLWLLITIGPLSVGPLYAEWLDVGGKVERGLTVYTVYVDTDSILRQGDIVTLWALFDYMSIQSIVGGPWLSSKARRAYDCVNKR